MPSKDLQRERATWPRVRIGDVAEVFDGPHATPTKTVEGPVFLGIGALNCGRLDLSKTEHLSEDEFVKWTRRVTPKAGDVVFSYETRIGEAAIIPEGLRCCLGRRMGLVRTDPLKLDPFFFLYQYLSPAFQEFLASRTIHGSTVDRIALKEFPDFEIDLPTLGVQREIAKVMLDIDSKIELNRRINRTLEAMAQAIFKSWFVDFDPVKAKIAALAEGRDPLHAAMSAISGKAEAELDALPPEHYEQLAATAALFPDEMEEAELGEIPRGWTVARVGNVLELVYGKALKSTDRQEGNVPVYGSGGITGYHNMPLVPHGSIVVGRKGTVGSLYWEDEPFFPIDTTYYVRPLAAPLTFCYYVLQTLGLEKLNTDAAVPGLNRENVYRLELVRPDSATLQKFDSEVTALRKAIWANSGANKSLANLRDILLPKLLSGELAVAEATAEAEE